jgi:hypothetical protein
VGSGEKIGDFANGVVERRIDSRAGLPFRIARYGCPSAWRSFRKSGCRGRKTRKIQTSETTLFSALLRPRRKSPWRVEKRGDLGAQTFSPRMRPENEDTAKGLLCWGYYGRTTEGSVLTNCG